MVLREGQVSAVLGPSGCGKTTLGDTLLGLAPPASGQVTWLGRSLDKKRRRTLRPRFQKLHQDPTTVFPSARSFGDTLSDLRRLPGEVSGGEAQRIALARLLVLHPAMLVADEPCSRLDMPVQAETMALLRGLADEHGLSVLLITHDAQMARGVADAALRLRVTSG